MVNAAGPPRSPFARGDAPQVMCTERRSGEESDPVPPPSGLSTSSAGANAENVLQPKAPRCERYGIMAIRTFSGLENAPEEPHPAVSPPGATGIPPEPNADIRSAARPCLYGGLTISYARQSGSPAEYGWPVVGFGLLSRRSVSFGHSAPAWEAKAREAARAAAHTRPTTHAGRTDTLALPIIPVPQ